MSNKASTEVLGELHAAIVAALKPIIVEGITVLDRNGVATKVTAPAAYFKEARELLKDNGIDAVPSANPALQSLAAVLPFPAPGDDPEMAVG